MPYSRNRYIPQTRYKLSRDNINNSSVEGYTLGFINCYCECYANRELLTVVLIASSVKGPLVVKDRDCNIGVGPFSIEFLEL